MKNNKTFGRTFDDVYREYSDMLYRIALSYLGRSSDAEDALHDVFLNYIESSPVFKDSVHEKAWFIRATSNRCHDIFRRRSVRSYTPLDEFAGDEPGEVTVFAGDGIFEVISSLDEKYRTPVTLHYLEGYSVEETASLLGLSVSAVKMRLMRARDTLKKIL